jgi:Macrocin-O-methyltransferase (TylF)
LAEILPDLGGGHISQNAIYGLNAVVNYLAVGQWMRAHGYDVTRRFETREQLFDLVGAEVGDKAVLYLEFGVFDGATTRYWSKLLRNPKSRLHGFDSFEGLPENWLPHRPKGHFSLGGTVPQMDDCRAQFFKGWFEESLPKYVCPPHDVLVMNLDADLYSSTMCVLMSFRDTIVPGTYIYFDEFNHQFHELRAFDEFVSQTGMSFELLGTNRTMEHALFRRKR